MPENNINEALTFAEKISLYQAVNSSDAAIKENFVVRINEFERIISSLANKKAKDPLQHELIIGRRGSGKSTLLKRIEIEIRENSELNQKYIPVNFPEEQASIYRLLDLWLGVLNELTNHFEITIEVRDFSEFKGEQGFTKYLYGVIHDILKEKKCRAVLLLDNFDRIVENLQDNANLLRETLINENDIQIIGGSTRIDEHFWKYDKPFFDFFRKHKLEALSSEEMKGLITHWGETLDLPSLITFVKNNPGRIESIRILTDGLPRTLQFFVQILLHDSDLFGYNYLQKIMDSATPLFQERLNSLTPPLRKIVSEMAFIWEACTIKQLVTACMIESKRISADIKVLISKGLVEKIETDTKNHLYRISERFFNMWYIITQGNPEQKRKAKWLTIFLENWYSQDEFKTLAARHIDDLAANRLSFDKGVMLTKAFSQSQYISLLERDEMLTVLETTPGYRNQLEYVHLPKKFIEIVKKCKLLCEDKNFEDAHKLLDSIENEGDGVKDYYKAVLFGYQEMYIESEKYYKRAIAKGHIEAMNNLALICKNQERHEEAEKYYLLAISKGYSMALYNLALLYHNQERHEEAEKYYLLAIAKDVTMALNNLAIMYKYQKKHKEAEKYYLLAVAKNNTDARFNLAFFYYSLNMNKREALDLILSVALLSKREKIVQLFIEIWNGKFDNISTRVINLLHDNSDLNAYIFHELLIHLQYNTVLEIFNNETIGKKLQDENKPMYYAVQILANANAKNVRLIIPPEINDTVNDIINSVKEKQKFYGYV